MSAPFLPRYLRVRAFYRRPVGARRPINRARRPRIVRLPIPPVYTSGPSRRAVVYGALIQLGFLLLLGAGISGGLRALGWW